MEGIKKTKQIPENKITKKQKMIKSKTSLYDSFQTSGVLAIKNASLLNKTEISKNRDNSKSYKSKRVKINSRDPDSMLLKDKDKVKHNNLNKTQAIKSNSNIHEVFECKPGTKLNRSEK